MSFDQSLFEVIHGIAGSFRALDIAAIFFARFFPYLLVAAFAFFLLLERDWKTRFYDFALASLSLILGRGIIIEAIRFSYYRPRPPVVLSIEPLISLSDSGSFPSGHAVVFFALATAVFILDRRWGIWFFGGAVVISLARIYVGVHWPLDVFAGALIGIASGLAIHYLLKRSNAKPALQ